MSIKKVLEGYQTDFRCNGRRYRQTFSTKKEAADFEQKMKFGGFQENTSEDSKLLFDGMKEYSEIELENKLSKNDEKSFLTEFYNYMVFELNLKYFNQVKLIHLNKYQNFLRQESARNALVEKVEKAKKENAKDSGIPYEPSKSKKKQGLSASSVNRHFSVIGDLFAWARLWEWVETNPTIELKKLKESPNERKPWPSDLLVQQAIELAEPWAAKAFFFIARTGVRPIGAKRLTWKDVDFENRIIDVWSYKGREGKLRRLKIPMSNDVYEFLIFLRRERMKMPLIGEHSQLVFHSATGLPLNSKCLAREMAKVTAKMNLEGYTLYGFRHKFATDLANPSADGSRAGNLESARKALGHSSISQTQRYNHQNDKILKNEVEKLAESTLIKFNTGTALIDFKKLKGGG